MRRTTSLLLVVIGSVLAAGEARGQEEPAAFERVGRLLQSRCAMPGCHAGPDARQGLRLESDRIYRSAVNVRARTDPRALRVAPGSPDQSLLYRKLLPHDQGHYRGPRMPLSMDPLTDEQIALVRQWIESFPADLWGHPPAAEVTTVRPRTFDDSTLGHLPTPDGLGRGTLEFRILHRFKLSAPDVGGEGLYGLDSGAWISLGLAYGLTNAIDVGLRRTNLQTDYEGYVQGTLLRQKDRGSPLSLSLRAGYSSARDPVENNRNRWSGQAILARRFGERFSLMLVPTYVTRTNFQDPTDATGTAAVGLGGQWRMTSKQSITAEWVAQTAGVERPYQSVSLGYSIATARHAFHLIATNAEGAHTDLYAPGGDLNPGDADFRLGFNITRWYTPHH